eukprot:5042764-Amphidinium_carterae.2
MRGGKQGGKGCLLAECSFSVPLPFSLTVSGHAIYNVHSAGYDNAHVVQCKIGSSVTMDREEKCACHEHNMDSGQQLLNENSTV